MITSSIVFTVLEVYQLKIKDYHSGSNNYVVKILQLLIHLSHELQYI